MTRNPLAWIGLAGVEPSDNARAIQWQARLQGPMACIALLVLLGYALEAADNATWHRLATILDAVIFCAFLGESILMASASNRPLHYLAINWLNVVILISTFASILDEATGWVALIRVMRVAVSGMVLASTATRFRVLFTRKGAPVLVGVAFLILLGTGGMFYWLEPTAKTYWEGLWLAFITGTTIGYGDIVPTTGPSKMLAAFSVLIGVSLMALFTANIVSFFVGNEELRLRRELQRDLSRLSETVERLLHGEGKTIHKDLETANEDLHRELHHLRRQIGQLFEPGDSVVVKQLRFENAELREDVERLKSALKPEGAAKGA